MVRLPTINDVAAAAGVSRQTVSNVLNEPGIVRPATRQRVRQAIRDLGYRPHASARRLRTRRAATLAVRVDDTPSPMVYALTRQAESAGLRVIVYTARDADDEIRAIDTLTLTSDVDAVVLLPTDGDDPRPTWLLDHRHAFVAVRRPIGLDDPRLRWVQVDVRAGVRAATEDLLGRGLRRIGYLGWPDTMVAIDDDRRQDWWDTLMAGRSDDDVAGLRVASRDDLFEGRAAARELAARNPGLQGVVAASDTLALAVLAELGETQPVVGFGNTLAARIVGISSVDPQPDMVARHVLALIRHPEGGPTHYTVTPRLVVRRPVPIGWATGLAASPGVWTPPTLPPSTRHRP
jgi:DNA-binding LacI/PurR family transcriptional regulator